MKTNMNYYQQIDNELRRHENGQYTIRSIDWCIDRIDWAWKWRKITRAQMNELADRVCVLLENERKNSNVLFKELP